MMRPLKTKLLVLAFVASFVVFRGRVFAEHLIEHLTFAEDRRFCSEVYRTLRPGGVVRLSTPDLQFLVRYYEDESAESQAFTEYHTTEFLRLDVRSRALVVSNFFYDFVTMNGSS